MQILNFWDWTEKKSWPDLNVHFWVSNLEDFQIIAFVLCSTTWAIQPIRTIMDGNVRTNQFVNRICFPCPLSVQTASFCISVCGMVSNIRMDKFHIYLDYDYFSYFGSYKTIGSTEFECYTYIPDVSNAFPALSMFMTKFTAYQAMRIESEKAWQRDTFQHQKPKGCPQYHRETETLVGKYAF